MALTSYGGKIPMAVCPGVSLVTNNRQTNPASDPDFIVIPRRFGKASMRSDGLVTRICRGHLELLGGRIQ
jgi:hypothetical protein